MGWASGSGVFDSIFKPLQELYDEGNMPAETLKQVAKIVIATFEDCDWDTQDESMDIFEGCEPIIEAFKELHCDWFEDNGDHW
jgi:hypothetical protein